MATVRKRRRVRQDYSRKNYRNPLFKRRTGGRSSIFKRWFWPIVGVSTVIGWIWFLGFSNTFRITEIDIHGQNKIPEWELRDSLEDLLSERRWLIIPKRSLLFLPEDDIKAHLNEQFVLESVDVLKDPPNKLIVTVTERVSSIFLQMPDGSQATLDLEGVVVRTYRPEEAIDITQKFGPTVGGKIDGAKEKLFVLFNDKEESAALRQKLLTPEVIKATIELPHLVRDRFGMYITAKEIHIDGVENSTLRIITSKGWAIYVDAEQSLTDQISSARVVVRDKVGEDRRRLEYVDVRFGEKIFFKLH